MVVGVMANEEFETVPPPYVIESDDEQPLLGDHPDHRHYISKFACTCLADIHGRPCMPQTSYSLSRINLLISLIWDVMWICILIWLTDKYLDPDQLECKIFIIVSFTAKACQVLSACIALVSRNKFWFGYAPYLLTQGFAALGCLGCIAFTFISWQTIETYAQTLIKANDIHQIRVEMSWLMVALAAWILCNVYSLAVVHEYMVYIRENKQPTAAATDESKRNEDTEQIQ